MVPLSRLAARMRAGLVLLQRLLLLLALLLSPAASASAATVSAATPSAAAIATPATEIYRCDGDPLIAAVHQGAVDAPGIPNSQGGTVPGAFIVLRWRGLELQLPRTNNAGPPSYTDGRWWWQALDPDHPAFAERRGGVTRFTCERDAG